MHEGVRKKMNNKAVKLKNKIKNVISRLIYQPGYPDWIGQHNLKLPKKPGVQKGITWCNAAANQILIELGYNTKPILDIRGIGWTNANKMHTHAETASRTLGTGVIEVKSEWAQNLANRGYAILATAYNNNGSGHVGIVCPSDGKYSPLKGPLIGQAGSVNGIRFASKSFTGLSAPKYYIIPRR